MKNFKSYLTEISLNVRGERPGDSEFQQLNNSLHEMLHEHYARENPMLSPNNPLKTPHFTTHDRNGDSHRLYSWGSWLHGVGSLAHAMTLHHFTQGSLTGRVGGQRIENPEHIERISDGIIEKHEPAITAFQRQHEKFLSQLSSAKGDPEIKAIVDRLISHHGKSLSDISDAHFNSYLNTHLVQSQIPFIQRYQGQTDPSQHDQEQTGHSRLHNGEVIRHEHPLGYFLNGGPRAPGSGTNLGIMAPTSIKQLSSSGDWQDVTHKFM